MIFIENKEGDLINLKRVDNIKLNGTMVHMWTDDATAEILFSGTKKEAKGFFRKLKRHFYNEGFIFRFTEEKD